MNVRIDQVTWGQRQRELLAIRHAVFVHEQGVPLKLEHDEHDRHALHLLASTPAGQAVGTARMLADGRIGRMAVLPAWRRQGIGGRMLLQLVDIARGRDMQRVFLHAQCAAESFYQRFGFRAEGARFLEAGIEHQRMRLDLGLD